MICRPRPISNFARSVMANRAWDPAPRSTEIIAARHMHQPNTGIHISSRLTMKVGSANSGISAKVSHID